MLNRYVFVFSLAFIPFIAQAQLTPTYPFIHVSGTGSTMVFPDIGEIDFEIAASDADAAAARSVVDARIAELRDTVAQAALPVNDIDISDVRQDLKKGQSNPEIYELRCSVKIIVRDLSKWRQVVEPLIGKSNLDGYSTSFDTTNREQVEMELMADAIKAAHHKAESMALGFGRKLGPVGAASSGELKNISRALNLMPNDMHYTGGQKVGQDRIDLLLVTNIKLMQQVDVIFKLL